MVTTEPTAASYSTIQHGLYDELDNIMIPGKWYSCALMIYSVVLRSMILRIIHTISYLPGMYKGLSRRPGRPPVVDSRNAQNVRSSVVGKDGGQT